MHEMFKTWKEPIPGSIDRRPVFPPDVTQPIENALIRATASGDEQVRRLAQGRQMPHQGVPYRGTVTPPEQRPPSQMNGYSGTPTQVQHANGGLYGPPAQPAPYQYPFQVCTCDLTRAIVVNMSISHRLHILHHNRRSVRPLFSHRHMEVMASRRKI